MHDKVIASSYDMSFQACFELTRNYAVFVTGVSCVGVFAAGSSAGEAACCRFSGIEMLGSRAVLGEICARVNVSLRSHMQCRQYHVRSFSQC